MSWRTLTSSSVHIDCTESFDAALFKWTRILAFSLDASLSQGTFIIALTAGYIEIGKIVFTNKNLILIILNSLCLRSSQIR